jgi:hypothetical protein
MHYHSGQLRHRLLGIGIEGGAGDHHAVAIQQGEAKLTASIEDQVVIDMILNHLQAKGGLPPTPELLPATRASSTSDWFVEYWLFTSLYVPCNSRIACMVCCGYSPGVSY